MYNSIVCSKYHEFCLKHARLEDVAQWDATLTELLQCEQQVILQTKYCVIAHVCNRVILQEKYNEDLSEDFTQLLFRGFDSVMNL